MPVVPQAFTISRSPFRFDLLDPSPRTQRARDRAGMKSTYTVELR
jgi:hypothetical protein